MRIARLLAAASIVAFSVGATSAHAQDALAGEFSGAVTFATDYVFRGVSQTDETPAVQGSITYTHESGVFGSIWGSNVDFDDGDAANLEIDFTLGYSNTVENFSYTVGAYYYYYPGVGGGREYDYLELGLTLGYDLGVIAPTASVYWTGDYFGGVGDAWYLTGGASVPVTESLSLFANVGRTLYSSSDLNDATDFNVGAALSYAGFDFDLRYVTYSDESLGDIQDDRVVLSVSRSF